MKNVSIVKSSAVVAALLAVASGCSASAESVSSDSAALGGGGGGGAAAAGGSLSSIMSPSDPSLACSDDLPTVQYDTQSLANPSCGSQTQWRLYADGVQLITVTCDAAAKDDPMPADTDPQALGQWWLSHACSIASSNVPDPPPDPCADAGYVGFDGTGILINRCVDATPGCGNIYDEGRDWGWVSSPSWYGQRQNDGTFIMNAPDTFNADCSADFSCCDFYDVPAGMAESEIHACDRFFVSSGGSSYIQVSSSTANRAAGLSAGGLGNAPSAGAAPSANEGVITFKAEPTTPGEQTSNGERLGHGSVGFGYALIAAGALFGSPNMVEAGQKFVKAGSDVVKVYETRREQRRRLEQERLPGQPAVVGPPDPTEAEVRRFLELATSRARAQEIADARRALEGGNRRIPPAGERPRPVDGDNRIPGSDRRQLPDRPRPRPRGR